MADTLHRPRASDSHAKDTSSMERPDSGKLAAKNDGTLHAPPAVATVKGNEMY
jgi:hypothetical protein